MQEAFSDSVTATSWLEDAHDWIHRRAEDAGLRLAGPIDQRRVRPWSTQLLAPTDRGPIWFKATCPSMRFEAALHQRLATLSPGDVPPPLAVDEDRGWILMTDRGVTLGDDHPPTIEDWTALVGRVAGLQRLVADEEATLLATGLPDCSPTTVVDRFEQMLERLADLPGDHPAHVTDPERRALLERGPQVRQAADTLAASPLPVTLQHGDVHPRNAFLDGRLLDFGDAQWAHAVEVLDVPYGWVKSNSDLPWERILQAWGAVWSDVVGPRELRILFEASQYTHAVNRAATWWGCLLHATTAEWQEWGEAPRHHLMRIIEA